MKLFSWVRWALGFACINGLAAETTIAVAANFSRPMQEIAAAFARSTGHQAVLVIGSTGKLSAQIRNGAPFDVFLAADQVTPQRLAADGFGGEDSIFTYAVGRLALWSAQPTLVDSRGAILATGDFRRLALADPKLAPYGAAAIEVLTALKLDARLRPRMVLGDSVGQAFLFVASGNAALGFVSLSQVQSDGRLRSGSVWLVPQNLYTPLRQDFVMLKRGSTNIAAQQLALFLRGAAARTIIRSHGYH